MAAKKKLSLEEAKAVVLADRDEQEAKRIEGLREYVGRFFKYRNSYGSGEKWWLYWQVTDVQPYMGCIGWRFQKTGNGTIEIDQVSHVSPEQGGWKEISAEEFWSAVSDLKADILSRLARPR